MNLLRLRTRRAPGFLGGFLLCAGLLVSGFPADVQAQVQLETDLGFQGTLRLGRWAPLRVSLSNSGRSRTGEVFVRVVRGAGAWAVEYVEPVELPHRGKRTLHFAIPVLGTDHPVVVGMREPNGRIVAEHEISLTEYRTAETLVLALTRDRDLEFLPSIQRRKTVVAYLRPEELPTQWIGLDSVRAIVVHDVSLSELDEVRYRALRQWVLAGGILVFAGGGSYSILQGPREADLLPVRVMGLARASRMPVLPNLPSMTLPQGEWVLIDSVEGAGEVLVRVEGKPLIARRSLGLGSVYFLAIDYASARLVGWRGNFALWRMFLSIDQAAVDVESLAKELDVNAENHPIAAVLRQPLLHFPPRAAVAGFVAAYLVLLGFVLKWMGAARRLRPLAWTALVGLAVGATALAALWMQEPLWRADGALLQLKIQTVHPGTDAGRAITHAGLFSARGGRHDLSLANATTVMRGIAGYGAQPAADGRGAVKATRRGGGLRWDNLSMDRLSTVTFTLESLAPSPVEISAAHEGGVTVLELKNRGSRALTEMAVLHRGKFYRLGTLNPGSSRSEDFFEVPVRPRDRADPVASTVARRIGSGLAGLGAEIPRQLIHRYFRTRILADVADRIIWMGWIVDDAPELRLIGGNQHNVTLTLVVAEIPL